MKNDPVATARGSDTARTALQEYHSPQIRFMLMAHP